MAEADEDAVVRTMIIQGDNDLTDELQDFRFLQQFSVNHHTIPRRGEKDFEHHGTTAQQDVLATSRSAMHSALSFTRVHPSKYKVTGTLHAVNSITTIENQKGQHFRTMGKADGTGRLHLLPEETLYLLERGSLDLRWSTGDGHPMHGMSLSLQSAYASLLESSGLTLEKYTVYAGLKRSGYVVQRSGTWNQPLGKYGSSGDSTLLGGLWWSNFRWLYELLSVSNAQYLPQGPLIGQGLYRNYGQIYRRLHLYHSADHGPSARCSGCVGPAFSLMTPHSIDIVNQDEQTQFKDKHSLSYCFDVWKPGPNFKKSNPRSPDFQIAVLDARDDKFPTHKQLDCLLASTSDDPLPERPGAQVYQKLKHGTKSAILAIVDQGVVSYVRMADSRFGNEQLYERSGKGHSGSKAGKRK